MDKKRGGGCISLLWPTDGNASLVKTTLQWLTSTHIAASAFDVVMRAPFDYEGIIPYVCSFGVRAAVMTTVSQPQSAQLPPPPKQERRGPSHRGSVSAYDGHAQQAGGQMVGTRNYESITLNQMKLCV